jgi:hypothetical protein
MAEEDARGWVAAKPLCQLQLGGNAPANQFIPDGQALKARLSSGSVKRAFSAGVFDFRNPGALRQLYSPAAE